jgi:Outer membrane cobalamin receptor protein
MFKSISLLPKAVLLGIAISIIVSYPLEASTKVEEDTLSVLLNSVTISAGVENVKRSPLRLKSVSADEIKVKSAGKTFPEIMSFTPGVYATRESGSYGDAKINIRGFKQDNISVLLNGIPISGLTSGNMFWNNWMGIADATAQIQLQKGIGASMLSDNSVGGTINIITNNSLAERKASVGYFVTSYGTQKTDMSYSSGELSNGWAVSVAGSYVWGSGYVECTNVNSWSYLASVSKKISDNHSFVFTALGSPEHHQQRSYRLSYAEMEKYGRDYNKNWGWYNNEKKLLPRINILSPILRLITTIIPI